MAGERIKHFLDDFEEVDDTTLNTQTTTSSLKNETTKTVEKEEEEVEEEEDTFEDEEEEETQEDDSSEEEDNDDSSNKEEESDELDFEPIISFLAEESVLILDEDKVKNNSYANSVEGVREIFNDTLEKKKEKWIEDTLKTPEAKDYFEYLMKGGSPSEYQQKHAEYPDYENVDLTKEAHKRMVIEEQLERQGYEAEEIAELIEDYDTAGLLDKHAAKALDFLKKNKEKELTEFKKEQETAYNEQVKKEIEEEKKFKEQILSKKDIAGFETSKKEMEDFYNWLTKPVIKDKDGNLVSQYLVEDTPEERLKMAFFKFKKFDFAKVERKQQSKAILNLKKTLDKNNNKLASNKGGSREEENPSKEKRLPDLPFFSM